MSRSIDGVLNMLRSKDDVLACLSNEEMLVCRSNEDVRLPCLTNMSRVGLRVREGGGPLMDLVFLLPNSSSETPPALLSADVCMLLTEAESLLPLSLREKCRYDGEGRR